MKHLLISCLFVFGSMQPCLGQSTDYTLAYYPNINEAELAIIREDHTAALSLYKKAFQSVKSGFARDYRNAIICATYTKDDAFAFEYLEKLVLKSMGKDFLSDTAYAPLRQKKGWGKLLKEYDNLHARSLKHINGPLLAELVAMAERDQLFRAKEGSYDVYGDTIAKIDLENVNRFRQLVKEFGFPSEDMIGAFVSEQNAPYNIVLLHHAQNLSNTNYNYPIASSLASIIELAAKEGKCSANHAGFLLTMQNDKSLNYGAMGINQLSVNGQLRPYFLLDKFSDDQLDGINQKRASIGLESLDDFRMKCQYRLDHPNTLFKLSSHQNLNIWDMDEVMAKDFEPYFDKITPTFQK
ncbi:MAG: hypothetical protein ACKVT2_20830 [Saprospiraceae bacterium]